MSTSQRIGSSGPRAPGASVLQRARSLRLRGAARDALEMLLGVHIAPSERPIWARELAEAALACAAMSASNRAMHEMMASATDDIELMTAGLALSEARLHEAEPILRSRLRDYPSDIVAIRLMAELATRIGRMDDAERLLRRALTLAPFFTAARELLARNLQRSNRIEEALTEVTPLLASEPADPSHLLLRASLLVKVGDQETAKDVYRQVVDAHPRQAKAWMSLGHVLKTLGERAEGVAAYRRAIAEQPSLGEAWWSLANLKTFNFSDADVEAMGTALDSLPADVDRDEDRLHLHFALGKACEDRRKFEAAFSHWRLGNALRRKALPYDADHMHAECAAAIRYFDEARLAAGGGAAAPDPVFIVGLPRAGSTLVEQILASHSQVEGTMELPDMMAIAARLRGDAADGLPERLAALTPADRAALGEEYLARTRVHRREGRPFFIDKMPNNWLHVGLIRTILPNAKIIDARRDAADCCLSAFKQHFARGQAFSNDLTDLGCYYRDYVAVMDHFDQAAPGAIHRVVYERMVENTEGEVRRLLDYCELPFEPACLAFWETDRAVRTASSEQVRLPIFTQGVGHWRHFERWLNPLFHALGPDLAPAEIGSS